MGAAARVWSFCAVGSFFFFDLRMLCFAVSVLERLKKFVTKMLGRLLAHLGNTVWSQFGGMHKLILLLRDENLQSFAFYFLKIAGVWSTAHQLVHNCHSSSRWILFCVCRPWNPTGQVLGLCLACLKSCDQQWNHTVELFCPSSSFSSRQWCSRLWLSVPTCGLGNRAEQYMNFNKCAPLSGTVPHAFLNFVSGCNN